MERLAVLRTAPVSAWFGIIVILGYIFVALFAPWIAPFGEHEIVGDQYQLWDSTHLLGTDNLGRDMLSRILFGARNTIGIALSATVITFIIGVVFGLLAATLGGIVDQVLSRIVDVMMAIPLFIAALLLLTIVGTSIFNMVAVIAILEATRVYRLTRAVAKDVVVLDFIESARLRGEKLPYLLRSEILPNITAPLAAEFGLRFCFVFLLIAALSFLGLGIQPPTADWGSMVRENSSLITFGDITPLLPAAAIGLLTIAVNFVVDWMLFRASGLQD
ncbi:ABC transporter permease [Roseovarius pelagicus]|uniref:ABC transporter permease n=1 Tax=Roseovarius pelagicus TaxID=2980108 RepID=A0ABY6D6G3_9RHOB|nr:MULTISPECIES: ABC transporter permease [Rhodobacterales]UXX81737.1 ABC transporter permease [Roseovarius pelagicus]